MDASSNVPGATDPGAAAPSATAAAMADNPNSSSSGGKRFQSLWKLGANLRRMSQSTSVRRRSRSVGAGSAPPVALAGTSGPAPPAGHSKELRPKQHNALPSRFGRSRGGANRTRALSQPLPRSPPAPVPGGGTSPSAAHAGWGSLSPSKGGRGGDDMGEMATQGKVALLSAFLPGVDYHARVSTWLYDLRDVDPRQGTLSGHLFVRDGANFFVEVCAEHRFLLHVEAATVGAGGAAAAARRPGAHALPFVTYAIHSGPKGLCLDFGSELKAELSELILEVQNSAGLRLPSSWDYLPPSLVDSPGRRGRRRGRAYTLAATSSELELVRRHSDLSTVAEGTSHFLPCSQAGSPRASFDGSLGAASSHCAVSRISASSFESLRSAGGSSLPAPPCSPTSEFDALASALWNGLRVGPGDVWEDGTASLRGARPEDRAKLRAMVQGLAQLDASASASIHSTRSGSACMSFHSGSKAGRPDANKFVDEQTAAAPWFFPASAAGVVDSLFGQPSGFFAVVIAHHPVHRRHVADLVMVDEEGVPASVGLIASPDHELLHVEGADFMFPNLAALIEHYRSPDQQELPCALTRCDNLAHGLAMAMATPTTSRSEASWSSGSAPGSVSGHELPAARLPDAAAAAASTSKGAGARAAARQRPPLTSPSAPPSSSGSSSADPAYACARTCASVSGSATGSTAGSASLSSGYNAGSSRPSTTASASGSIAAGQSPGRPVHKRSSISPSTSASIAGSSMHSLVQQGRSSPRGSLAASSFSGSASGHSSSFPRRSVSPSTSGSVAGSTHSHGRSWVGQESSV